eukprot:TRINITY_DN1676_c0_g3_i4.p1 TRINITY_DN1676_c0_g3~~TRINITY_DN1676_c0_g3_i4.p1  ORF type:complete len:468 (-),score=94.26 TRINITY_DN1676_c0_g3_i4:74-1435(-)
MTDIPTEDGITTRIDEQGRIVKVERSTKHSETEKEKVEEITVITSTDEPTGTRVVTQVITITLNKQTGNKTTKRKKNTSVTKKVVQDDEEEEFLIVPDGVSEFTDRESARRVNVRLSTVLGESNFKRTRLIFGVDFTRSNTWNGRNTFNGSGLHTVGQVENPYQRVLRVVGEALEGYSVDKKILTFGFGDQRTHARDTFSFFPDCVGGKDYDLILEQYKEIAKSIQLSGPTSWAPVIRKAIEVTKSHQGHHTLVLITDDPADESKVMDTRHAIEEAHQVPLTIIVVGVGDNHWVDNCEWREWPSKLRAGEKYYWKRGTEITEPKMPPEFKEYMESDHTPSCLFWYDEEGNSHKYSNVSFVDWRQLIYKHKEDELSMAVDLLSSLVNHEKLTSYNEKHVLQAGERYRTHAEIKDHKRRKADEQKRPDQVQADVKTEVLVTETPGSETANHDHEP